MMNELCIEINSLTWKLDRSHHDIKYFTAISCLESFLIEQSSKLCFSIDFNEDCTKKKEEGQTQNSISCLNKRIINISEWE